jgi:hypothetical protein
MILVAGNDPVVAALCSALELNGRPYQRVEALDVEQAWSSRATTVVLVEPLLRFGAIATSAERDLREIIRSANAPGVRTAILVTPRADADPGLRAVRRSGIPYTILRPAPIFDPAAAASRAVLVPRRVASAPAQALAADMVVDAIVAALDGNACGQTIDVGPAPGTTWLDVLARSGVTPRAVPAWRARVGRWFGAQTLDPTISGASSSTAT